MFRVPEFVFTVRFDLLIPVSVILFFSAVWCNKVFITALLNFAWHSASNSQNTRKQYFRKSPKPKTYTYIMN